jgi:hypothetical protein
MTVLVVLVACRPPNEPGSTRDSGTPTAPGPSDSGTGTVGTTGTDTGSTADTTADTGSIPAPSKPGPDNTGVPAGTVLTPSGSLVIEGTARSSRISTSTARSRSSPTT